MMSNQDYIPLQLCSYCPNAPRNLEQPKKSSFYKAMSRVSIKTERISPLDDRNFSQFQACPSKHQAILITAGQLDWTVTILEMKKLQTAVFLTLEKGMWPLIFESQGLLLLHESAEQRSSKSENTKKVDLYRIADGISPEMVPLSKEDSLVSSLNSKSDRLRILCIQGKSVFLLNYSGLCRYQISTKSIDTLINFGGESRRTVFGSQENIFGMVVAHRYNHEIILLTNLTDTPSEYVVRRVRVSDACVLAKSKLNLGTSKRFKQLMVFRDSLLLSFSRSSGAEYRLYDLKSLECTDTLTWNEKSSYNRTQDELFHFVVRRCEFVFLDVVKEKNIFHLKLAGLYRGKFHQVLSKINHSFCKSHLQMAKQIYSTSTRSICLARNLDDNRLYTWWRWEIYLD
jgi:hypothetical protein